MLQQITREAAKALHSRRGSVVIMLALMLTMLIGFTALGTEVAFALYKQRQMQSVATAAALGGAAALMTGHPANPATEAAAIAATAGFVDGTGGVTVTVNHPPLSGAHIGNTSAVEVIVAQPRILPLSGLFVAKSWNISARAVATQGNNAGDCILTLDTSTLSVDSVGNGANVLLNKCGMAVNGTGTSALSVTGGATLTAQSVTVVGLTRVSNGGSIVTTNGVKTLQSPVANPYASKQIPSSAGCNHNNLNLAWAASPQVLTPGVYCNGLSMGNGAIVVMNPGVYIINGGSFAVQGGITLTGTGVTIVLTGSGGNYATVTISNGVNVTLSAPTTGTTAGLVFFADPNAPNTLTSSVVGGASVKLTGALYFPTQTVNYSNGTTTTATCTQLVAWQVTFTGGASFNSNCATAGTGSIGTSPSQLVE